MHLSVINCLITLPTFYSQWNEIICEKLISQIQALRGKKIVTRVSSVTRLGDFWKFLGTELLAKIVQIFSNIFGLIWNRSLFTLNWCGYFLGNLWEIIGLLFTPTSGHTYRARFLLHFLFHFLRFSKRVYCNFAIKQSFISIQFSNF